MATGNTLWAGDLLQGKRDNPNSMTPGEKSYGPAGAGGKRKILRAPKGQDTEAIYEFMVPHLYSAATGLTLNVAWTVDPPAAGGAVVLEAAFERLTENVAGSVVSADSWGTPATATATAPTVAGRVDYQQIAVVKANFGGGTGASLAPNELCRARLRVLFTNAGTTVTGDVLILGVSILET